MDMIGLGRQVFLDPYAKGYLQSKKNRLMKKAVKAARG